MSDKGTTLRKFRYTKFWDQPPTAAKMYLPELTALLADPTAWARREAAKELSWLRRFWRRRPFSAGRRESIRNAELVKQAMKDE